MQMHTKVLPVAAQALISQLSGLPSIRDFYLSGGTALALQVGHRESEDLDFFTQIDFNPQVLQRDLIILGALQDTEIDIGTLNTFIDGVKLQFLHYPYQLLDKLIPWNGIQLSSVIDIACTKLVTISMRGNKKDFIDLYIILKHYSLKDLLKRLEEKYQNVEYNHTHILKSLVYFTDADKQPMPKMHILLNWDEVKDAIIKQVKVFKI